MGNAKRLIELYESGGIPWETSAALGCNAANGLLRLGNVDPALTMLRSLCQQFPRSMRPRQLLGLALARRGEEEDLQEAQTTLAELYAAGERDPETLGIYARTWMDRYQRSGDSNHLRKSRDLYALAFLAAQDDYYTGINAAAKSALLGEIDTAAEQAAQVATLVGTDCVPDDYWMSATVAEVQLLEGNWATAAQRYADAVAIAPEEHGSHKSTASQARRLMDNLHPSDQQRHAIEQAFDHPGCRAG